MRDLITLFLPDPEDIEVPVTAAPRDPTLLAYEALSLRAMLGDLDTCELEDLR